MKEQKFHLSLFVSDTDKTVNFYTRLFGTEPSKVKSDYVKFELADPALVITFLQAPDKVQNHFGHLGFLVNSTEEVEARKDALKTSGIEIGLEEQEVACCYAKQDKFWVNDPDGYEWEVYHFIEDVNQNEEKYTAAPCC
ncbi:MAG: ArsI/CadI family heavy metal resistance metalloenzyme [Cytophagales bacterium]|nr:ArsI/CadI family heavy metal resistance metalloenzyme [Cytophagales bacterium]